MKRYLNTSASIAIMATFLAAGTSANASDLFNSPNSTKDADVHYQAPKTNWGGFYIGGAVGYGNANHDLSVRDYFEDYCEDDGASETEDFNPFEDRDRDDTLASLNDGKLPTDWNFRTSCEQKVGHTAGDPPVTTPIETGDDTIPGASREVARLDGLNSTGIVGDLRIGADVQQGRFVGGVFASYGLSGMEGEGVNSPFEGFGDFSLERGDDWSVGARAGLLVNDRTLLYILAAYTQTEYEFSGTFNEEAFSQKTTFSGVTVGGGIEFAATNNVFLGLEATHTFYGGEAIFDHYDPETNVGTLINDDLGETKIMGTLKIKLNSGLLGN